MWVTLLHVFFGFPSSTFDILISPKNLHTSNLFISQPLDLSIQNLNRHLFIAQIFLYLHILQWHNGVFITNELPQHRNMENGMNHCQLIWQVQLISYFSHSPQNFIWTNIPWAQLTLLSKPHHTLHR